MGGRCDTALRGILVQNSHHEMGKTAINAHTATSSKLKLNIFVAKHACFRPGFVT